MGVEEFFEFEQFEGGPVLLQLCGVLDGEEGSVDCCRGFVKTFRTHFIIEMIVHNMLLFGYCKHRLNNNKEFNNGGG